MTQKQENNIYMIAAVLLAALLVYIVMDIQALCLFCIVVIIVAISISCGILAIIIGNFSNKFRDFCLGAGFGILGVGIVYMLHQSKRQKEMIEQLKLLTTAINELNSHVCGGFNWISDTASTLLSND